MPGVETKIETQCRKEQSKSLNELKYCMLLKSTIYGCTTRNLQSKDHVIFPNFTGRITMFIQNNLAHKITLNAGVIIGILYLKPYDVWCQIKIDDPMFMLLIHNFTISLLLKVFLKISSAFWQFSSFSSRRNDLLCECVKALDLTSESLKQSAYQTNWSRDSSLAGRGGRGHPVVHRTVIKTRLSRESQ